MKSMKVQMAGLAFNEVIGKQTGRAILLGKSTSVIKPAFD